MFDFSAAGCDQKDLSFTMDGRVDYIKRDSLPEVLKLGDLEKAELEARLGFCRTKEFKLNFDNKTIEQAKKEYKVDNVTTDNFKDFQKSLSSNHCTNLKDFYNVDSYNDKLVDLYIEFYQKTKIDYEYWCSECAQKFLKDEKGKKEKSEIEIAKIELQFLKHEVEKRVDLYQRLPIPYKLWDSDAKKYYYAKLQMKWFKIGCIPLFIFIGSFFIPGWQIIKIIVMLVSFLCGLCVVKKGIKNKMDYDYTGDDTYDNISNIISNQEDLNSNKGIEVNNINNRSGSTEHENEDENEISTSSNGSGDENTNRMEGNSNDILMFRGNLIGDIIDKDVKPLFENNNHNNQAKVKNQ